MTPAGAKTALVLGTGAVLGTIAAGGIRHRPAAAPAASPPGVTRAGTGYDVLALLVAAFVVLVAIGLYWRHRARLLAAEIADTDGFHRRRSWQLRELWECPVCGSLLRLDAVSAHSDPNYSICAAYQAWLDEHEGTPVHEFIRGMSPNWAAQASAQMVPDNAVTAGGYDTLTAGNAGELED